MGNLTGHIYLPHFRETKSNLTTLQRRINYICYSYKVQLFSTASSTPLLLLFSVFPTRCWGQELDMLTSSTITTAFTLTRDLLHQHTSLWFQGTLVLHSHLCQHHNYSPKAPHATPVLFSSYARVWNAHQQQRNTTNRNLFNFKRLLG